MASSKLTKRTLSFCQIKSERMLLLLFLCRRSEIFVFQSEVGSGRAWVVFVSSSLSDSFHLLIPLFSSFFSSALLHKKVF